MAKTTVLSISIIHSFLHHSDFCLEQPRVKQLGYGAVIDHVGGKLSTFGEAASIPFAENDQIFDHRGEQKLS